MVVLDVCICMCVCLRAAVFNTKQSIEYKIIILYPILQLLKIGTTESQALVRSLLRWENLKTDLLYVKRDLWYIRIALLQVECLRYMCYPHSKKVEVKRCMKTENVSNIVYQWFHKSNAVLPSESSLFCTLAVLWVNSPIYICCSSSQTGTGPRCCLYYFKGDSKIYPV